MALTATVHRFEVELADVDRGVYASLDLRVARHPSETKRYMLLRLLAYCLSYEEGIAFSKGGLSSADEAPISVRDATGALLAWIDVGSPSAERLHKAAKAAERVAVFTSGGLAALRKEAATRSNHRPIHKAESIAVWDVAPPLLDALDAKIDRHAALELTRNDGHLYIAIGATTLEAPLAPVSLAGDDR